MLLVLIQSRKFEEFLRHDMDIEKKLRDKVLHDILLCVVPFEFITDLRLFCGIRTKKLTFRSSKNVDIPTMCWILVNWLFGLFTFGEPI